MTHFALFDKTMAVYNKTVTSTQNPTTTQTDCPHLDTIKEGDIVNCIQCGEELQHHITHEREWRYYQNDSKHSSNPTRVQMRKVEERSIRKDVENMNFSDMIINKADQLYFQVTKGQIYRGNSRKAIIFACIFHAYKILGKHQTPDNLVKLFGLTRKTGLKGLKIVNVNAPKDSEIHTTNITPVHIIREIMSIFDASETQKQEVSNLYEQIKNRSSKLNRARPQSLAAALTYYWIQQKKLTITLREFAERVDLSELTITKNVTEITTVLQPNENIYAN
jgi:transcription initiation factor TFIIIB Brf1 subunit/transcription initiation factor TFIIB